MLPRRVLDVLGLGLVILGLAKYFESGYQEFDAVVLGLALGAGVVASGRIAGGPQPVPEGGYNFEGAMHVLRRATWGGLTVAGALVGFGFYFWIRNVTGPFALLVLFALGLLVVYASLVASASLIIVAALVGGDAKEGADKGDGHGVAGGGDPAPGPAPGPGISSESSRGP